MATRVPITPSILEWAMEEAGVDVPEVADRAGVGEERVLAWLAGEEQPTKTQFGHLTRLFKRPPAFFLLPEAPEARAVPASFRHPPGGPRDASRAELEAVRIARRVQTVARWTAERLGDVRWLTNPAPAAANMTPNEAAEAAVSWLDWSSAHQQSAPDGAAVVRAVRQRLEEHGALAVHLSMGAAGCRGFSLYGDRKPLVAVNTHYNAEARLFTYIHELGHLMRRTDAICIGFAETLAERWCERFAAAFLIPVKSLEQRIAARFGGDTLIRTLAAIRLLARDFNVSQTAMAIRLEDTGWGTDGLVELIPRASDFKSGGGGPGTDNTRGARRLREFGEGYFSLLLAAEREGQLGRQDVLRYLDVSEGQLRRLTGESAELLET